MAFVAEEVELVQIKLSAGIEAKVHIARQLLHRFSFAEMGLEKIGYGCLPTPFTIASYHTFNVLCNPFWLLARLTSCHFLEEPLR